MIETTLFVAFAATWLWLARDVRRLRKMNALAIQRLNESEAYHRMASTGATLDRMERDREAAAVALEWREAVDAARGDEAMLMVPDDVLEVA
jgi:hypothetical protein